MKTGPDAVGTAENEYKDAKLENRTRRPSYRRKRVRGRQTRKWDPTLSVLPKTCPRSQNLKMGPDALTTAENEYGNAKHENGTNALGIAGNEFGSAKRENKSLRPR
jgi:hypothetical protein